MVSSLTERGCETTLKALELGAVDFVTKPKLDMGRGVQLLGEEIVEKVKVAARTRPRRPGPRAPLAPAGSTLERDRGSTRIALAKSTEMVVAIGASTGGTEALRELLCAMPADGPGIVIVQHMPEHFTRAFADRLDTLCAMRVREAADGDRILPGFALIAPGGTCHMKVQRSGGQYVVRLIAAPPENHHRPSVDVLFESCAQQVARNAIGVILTGMGADGARGLQLMRQAGARTIAEHESTCVVYGMPRVAVQLGAVESVLPLPQIAPALIQIAMKHGSVASG
jgi:two-component system chemotaxis response regulator CheB